MCCSKASLLGLSFSVVMGRNSPPVCDYELQQFFFLLLLHSLGPGHTAGKSLWRRCHGRSLFSNPTIRHEETCVGGLGRGPLGPEFFIFVSSWWYGVPGMTKEKHHQRHIVIVCAQIEDHIFLFPPLGSSKHLILSCLSLSSAPASCHPPLGCPPPCPL